LLAPFLFHRVPARPRAPRLHACPRAERAWQARCIATWPYGHVLTPSARLEGESHERKQPEVTRGDGRRGLGRSSATARHAARARPPREQGGGGGSRRALGRASTPRPEGEAS